MWESFENIDWKTSEKVIGIKRNIKVTCVKYNGFSFYRAGDHNYITAKITIIFSNIQYYHIASYIDKAASWFHALRLSPDWANRFPAIITASGDDVIACRRRVAVNWSPWQRSKTNALLGNAGLLDDKTLVRSASWAGLQMELFADVVARRDIARFCTTRLWCSWTALTHFR